MIHLPLNPVSLTQYFQGFSSEVLSLILLIVCVLSILGLLRLLGEVGLYIFIAIATVSSNIQVLKLSYFKGFSDPVALGTIVFAATYLTTDILNEYYGEKAARKGIWVGFLSMILMSVFMFITLGFPDASGGNIQSSMETLFFPVPALFMASLMAYGVSQYNDIWIFSAIRKMTGVKFLWLRTTLSTIISAFVDNVIFSVLAFMVFAPIPKEWAIVWGSYIMGTYGFRVLGALVSFPVIYLAKYVKPTP